MSFHASRRPISVVKSVLHPNCTDVARLINKTISQDNATSCMWKPFDKDNYNAIFGFLDLSYLLSYAFFMFFSGNLADRVNLRIFLTVSCFLCGLTTATFGLGYFLNVHSLIFYFAVQVIGGLVQSSGWPAVLACMGNWLGEKRRGLIFGLWNAHSNLGNILGGVLASLFVDYSWGWCFIVPGILLSLMGILVFFFLIPHPSDVYGTQTKKIKHILPVVENSDLESTLDEEEDVLFDMIETPLLTRLQRSEPIAIRFTDALRVPGTIEYAFCLFFNKLVSYTFLFWLPWYIHDAEGFAPSLSANISLFFDFGGLMGGLLAGVLSDRTAASALICVSMILAGIPFLYAFHFAGTVSIAGCIGWLIPMGVFINGPYSLITTVISTNLGQHHSIRGNVRAMATMTAILDGTGSIGAAIGPLICGLLINHGWIYIFVFLMSSLAIAALLLFRLLICELRHCRHGNLGRQVE